MSSSNSTTTTTMSSNANVGSNNERNYQNLHKTDSQDDSWSSTGYNYINPFMHKLVIDDSFDIAKFAVLTVVLFPIRVVGVVLSLFTAWVFTCIGIHGLTLEKIRERPMRGWRRQVQKLVAGTMRIMYAAGTFQYIKFRGARATSKEAPLMVVAPHTSYADSIIVVSANPPSVVAKEETSKIPLLGKIVDFTQPIYVSREDPNSRQNTIKEITRRAQSEEVWPQIVIFPEGTCTNATALIKFKPGAFYPGVPVQPVLIKYPNKHDTYTWTWDGPGVFKLIWLTFAKLYSNCEIEFLPVYNPSEAEKADANLYARNVRHVMARALNIPTSEFSFEDVIVMNRAKDMKIPFPGDIITIERTLDVLELLDADISTELAANYCHQTSDLVDLNSFSELLKISSSNPQMQKLFSILDHNKIGVISLKSFLLCAFFCKKKNNELIDFLRVIANIYSDSSQNISREQFKKLMRHCQNLPEKKYDVLFFSIDYTNKGTISFDDFEQYCREGSEYNFLFKKQEEIRRRKK